MKKNILTLVIAIAFAVSAFAQKMSNPVVGGAEMYPTKDIVDNAVNSKDHTTLITAVQAANLVDVLKGKGPFTVFAPTNDAFNKLPDGTFMSLLRPENKTILIKILTYHVVASKIDAKSLIKTIKNGGGYATLKTVSGRILTAIMSADMKSIELVDEKGGKSMITQSDVMQKNGIIHVINSVMLPN
ncbi:fasciclin domain-containing protein [Solitalea koreensis]|uniref:Uncaracterized surface protein containing fasciclin (FAS1) repeats n=1 Tax=Solitalea koreensis TaxID=543615 RepID=A0A521BF61_9SPHI|nr:fasciclin domain-containing protein [Solitalea koreensis]SMO45748.1 Uncaracterized surface protein containing fasciclin (FAS1) repeats [Solitalea koreensis]